MIDLVESDVGDDLAADMGVEAADDILALHGELHAEGGVGEVDEERLVADEEIVGIGVDGLAHHLGPRVDEALLQQRRFKALIAEGFENDFFDGDAGSTEHIIN